MVVDIKQYKVGDRVLFVDDSYRQTEGTVTDVRLSDLTIQRDDGVKGGGHLGGWLVDSSGHNGYIVRKLETKENKAMGTLKSIWKSINRSEPEKTYIKAGILNDNEEFTDEGKVLFLEYLLGKNPEFKEVAEQIVAEKEKK